MMGPGPSKQAPKPIEERFTSRTPVQSPRNRRKNKSTLWRRSLSRQTLRSCLLAEQIAEDLSDFLILRTKEQSVTTLYMSAPTSFVSRVGVTTLPSWAALAPRDSVGRSVRSGACVSSRAGGGTVTIGVVVMGADAAGAGRDGGGAPSSSGLICSCCDCSRNKNRGSSSELRTNVADCMSICIHC